MFHNIFLLSVGRMLQVSVLGVNGYRLPAPNGISAILHGTLVFMILRTVEGKKCD